MIFKLKPFQIKVIHFRFKLGHFQSFEITQRVEAAGKTHPNEGGEPFPPYWTLPESAPTTKIEENLR